jgi:GntR family transcriptional regulator
MANTPKTARCPRKASAAVCSRSVASPYARPWGDLQKEGLIFKIHGKGTFVAKPKTFQNVSTLQGLAESMTGRGYEVINRLRSFKFIPADKRVAERLRLAEGETVAQIKRVRLINR